MLKNEKLLLFAIFSVVFSIKNGVHDLFEKIENDKKENSQ